MREYPNWYFGPTTNVRRVASRGSAGGAKSAAQKPPRETIQRVAGRRLSGQHRCPDPRVHTVGADEEVADLRRAVLERRNDLAARDAQVAQPIADISVMWHERTDADPGAQYFRHLAMDAVRR